MSVTIEETAINPTDEQAQACLRVCQMLSNGYRNIELFRFNPQTGIVFIFASEELQVVVPPNVTVQGGAPQAHHPKRSLSVNIVESSA